MAETSTGYRRYVGVRETLVFGAANGGQEISYSLITMYLMYFYINVFQVDAKIVAVMFFLEGIWDFFNNPLMGVLIDRTRTRFGKMSLYLRGFTGPQAVATVLMFAGPLLIKNTSPTAPAKIIYMYVSYFLWETCYTVTDVSFWGLSAAISPNPEDRTRVLTSANMFCQVTCIIGNVGVPILLDIAALPNSRVRVSDGFFILGLIAGVLGVGLFSLSGFLVKERIPQSTQRPSFREILISVVKNRPLMLLILSNIISVMSGVGGVFAAYYYIDVLGFASLTFLVEIPAFFVLMISYSLIPKFKKRLNNRTLVILSKTCVSVMQFLVFLVGCRFYASRGVMIPLIIGFNLINALFVGVLNVVSSEMLAEATDYAEWKTGKRNEGISFSIKISTTKFNGTIAQSLGALLLSGIGYVVSSGGVRVEQTAQVQFRIWTAFFLIPAVMQLFCTVPLYFYDLVGGKRETMFRELARRREEQE